MTTLRIEHRAPPDRMMRALAGFLIASLMLLWLASPVSARVLRMETTVALADHSEASIEAALRQALEIAVRSARANGLSSLWFAEARLLEDAIVVATIATDEEDEEENSPAPGARKLVI